ncbi:CobQ/CobB/MinD/ParA nucleotide binding domain protein [compost metagenome]
MIIILKIVTFVSSPMVVKWLQGDPGLPDNLRSDPIWSKISHVHVADSQSAIPELTSQFGADLIFMDASLLNKHVEFAAYLLKKFPNARQIYMADTTHQDLIDFCLDNGIYDLIVGQRNSKLIKHAIIDAYTRDEVAMHRSSNPVKVSAQAVLKEAEQDDELDAGEITVAPVNSTQRFAIATFSMKSIGKTSTAINTAIAMTQMGYKTIVVDVNRMTPDVGAYVGIKRGTPGIERYFTGTVPIHEINTLIHSVHGLDVIPMGSKEEVIASSPYGDKIDELFNYLYNHYGYNVIIFDLSPDIDLPLSRFIIKRSNLVLLVVNQLPASVENMYNQVAKIQNFCNKTPDQMSLVVTSFLESGINGKKIESYLGVKIIGQVPLDMAGFNQSIKTRVPYVASFPKKIGPFMQIATKILGQAANPAADKKSGSGLLNRLKGIISKK